MKMKDFENLRRAEILAAVIINIVASKNANVDPEFAKFALTTIDSMYMTDILISGRTATVTKDYKDIASLYSEVISRTADLAEEFGLDDPIEVFAFFVYLYRNGFLSRDRDFAYDLKLKDFPNIQGVDVIRGKGVCRTISSMLSDVYYELGYDVTNLMVYATEDSVRQQIKLCTTPLKKNVDCKKWVDLIIAVTSKIELGNHQITMVKDGDKQYILDPTNDGILSYDPETKLIYTGDEKKYMKHKPIQQLLCGMMMGGKTALDAGELRSDVDLEDYKEKYLRTLKLCKSNIYVLLDFYKNNRELYEEICSLLSEQNDLLRRFMPIIPNFEVPFTKKLANPQK